MAGAEASVLATRHPHPAEWQKTNAAVRQRRKRESVRGHAAGVAPSPRPDARVSRVKENICKNCTKSQRLILLFRFAYICLSKVREGDRKAYLVDFHMNFCYLLVLFAWFFHCRTCPVPREIYGPTNKTSSDLQK